ncbi:MAG: GIY-YIG nuclease family protein, partial [Prolixibacteraceae bacterium]
GSCVDIQKRLQRHNAGATQSTKPYRPWQLVHAEEYATKTEALIRENYIKRMKSSTYIKSEFDFNVLVE